MARVVAIAPSDLRGRYISGHDDEFGRFADTELDQFIERALDDVETYIPASTVLGEGEKAVITRAYAIARAYAHEDRGYGSEHIVMIQYREALKWLRDVGAGKVALAKAVTSIAGGERTPALTDETLGKADLLG